MSQGEQENWISLRRKKKKRLRERLLKKEKNNFRKFPLYLLPDQIKLRRGSPSLRLLFNHSCETELISKKTTDRRNGRLISYQLL